MISFNHKWNASTTNLSNWNLLPILWKCPSNIAQKVTPCIIRISSYTVYCPFSINGSVQSFVIVVHEAPNSYRWYCCHAQSFWQKPLGHSKSLVIFRETFLKGGTKLSAKAHISDFQISDHHFRLTVGPLSYFKLAWSFTEKYLLLLGYKVSEIRSTYEWSKFRNDKMSAECYICPL